MKPKNLIERFLPFAQRGAILDTSEKYGDADWHYNSKQCALIALEFAMDEIKDAKNYPDKDKHIFYLAEKYQSLKKELE